MFFPIQHSFACGSPMFEQQNVHLSDAEIRHAFRLIRDEGGKIAASDAVEGSFDLQTQP
jgi:hypothetical protein